MVILSIIIVIVLLNGTAFLMSKVPSLKAASLPLHLMGCFFIGGLLAEITKLVLEV